MFANKMQEEILHVWASFLFVFYLLYIQTQSQELQMVQMMQSVLCFSGLDAQHEILYVTSRAVFFKYFIFYSLQEDYIALHVIYYLKPGGINSLMYSREALCL